MKVSGNPENAKDKVAIQCFNMLQEIYSKEYSEVMDLFYGIYVTIITTPNNKKILSMKPEHYFILDIPVYSQTKGVLNTLYEGFDTFTELEFLSGDGIEKLNHLVDFPLENLDLSKYVIGYKNESFVYDLFGICNHCGTIMGGHYTSFVRNATNEWVHYNDSSVEKVENVTSIISPMAYCLFYRKKIPRISI